jgi:hypothetical protein
MLLSCLQITLCSWPKDFQREIGTLFMSDWNHHYGHPERK